VDTRRRVALLGGAALLALAVSGTGVFAAAGSPSRPADTHDTPAACAAMAQSVPMRAMLAQRTPQGRAQCEAMKGRMAQMMPPGTDMLGDSSRIGSV